MRPTPPQVLADVEPASPRWRPGRSPPPVPGARGCRPRCCPGPARDAGGSGTGPGAGRAGRRPGALTDSKPDTGGRTRHPGPSSSLLDRLRGAGQKPPFWSRRRRQRSSKRSIIECCEVGAAARAAVALLAAAPFDEAEARVSGGGCGCGRAQQPALPAPGAERDVRRAQHDHETDDPDRGQLDDGTGHQHDDTDEEHDRRRSALDGVPWRAAWCRAWWRRASGRRRPGRVPSARAVAAPLPRAARFLPLAILFQSRQAVVTTGTRARKSTGKNPPRTGPEARLRPSRAREASAAGSWSPDGAPG